MRSGGGRSFRYLDPLDALRQATRAGNVAAERCRHRPVGVERMGLVAPRKEQMKNRNFALDAIRMCAILPVLAGHYMTFAVKDTPTIFYILADLGVEIFFALSGFLIGGIILRDFESGFSWKVARNFYVRRWMRTLPLYYMFFVVSTFVTVGGLTLDQNWSVKCLAYLAFLQNLAWPMVDWFQESWSLAVEEWFYLLFPVLFAALIGLRARTRILVIALVLIVMPLALRIHVYNPASDFDLHVRRVVVLRLDAIAYGILAVWAVRTFDLRRWAHVIGAAGLIGAVLTVLFMKGAIYPGDFFARTFTMSVASASFAAVVLWASFQSWRPIGFVKWVSTRSYALYLCNGTVMKTMLHHGWFAKTPVVSFLIFSTGCFLLAEVAHRLIEQPFMHRRPRELQTTASDARAESPLPSPLHR
jgi:peptidoglycan/LPS O-acetylase OafA/YrhL